MVLVNGDINKMIAKLKAECEEQDLEGIFIAAVNKVGRPTRLDGMFFYFTPVTTPFGQKGLFIGERQNVHFKDPIPLMVVFEDTGPLGGILFEPFETNHLNNEEMWGLLSTLKMYLDKLIPEEKMVVRNTKKIEPFLMPESKTIH